MENTKVVDIKEWATGIFGEKRELVLKENHVWCQECHGMGFNMDQDGFGLCRSCLGKGMIELCENGCGNPKYERWAARCEECQKEYMKNDHDFASRIAVKKSDKISYADYNGYFQVDDRLLDKDEFEEFITDHIEQGNRIRCKAVYASVKRLVLTLDFENIVMNECEDGYEDMFERLDQKGFSEIQALIDNWVEKQGESAYVYEQDYGLVVLLDEIIEEICEDIRKRKVV